MTQRHDAFISYSHGADASLAECLETGLERFAKPVFKLRAIDVFRDKSSLSAAPGLWTSIEEHLSGSTWLVVMASPASAASPWCNKEIAWWLEHRSAANVLVVLTEGDLVWDPAAADFDWSRTTALSPTLRAAFSEEPHFVDLRWSRTISEPAAADARFRPAILDLAAPIRGVPKDQLDGEDVRQLRRTRRIARAGVTTITVVAALAVWQAIEATRQRREAERQRDTALSRQLAAQSSEMRVREPRLSLLLAAQAHAASPSTEASTALLRALNTAPFARMVERPETFWSLVVTGDEEWAVIGDGAAGVQRVNLATGEVTRLGSAQNQGAVSRATLAVAVAPDGLTMASGGFDQLITLWNRGQVVRTIANHQGFILDLAFSPDGRRLASAGTDGRVFLHDLALNSSTTLKDSWTPEASAVRFSPDGRVIAAGGDNGFHQFYDVSDGRTLRAPAQGSAAADSGPAPSTSVVAQSFSADGSELFVGFFEGVISIYDARTRVLTGRVQAGAYGRLETMAIAPDGRRLFTGHGDGSVVAWRRPRATYEGWTGEVLYRHSSQVQGMAYMPRARQLVTAGFDGRLFMSRPDSLPPATGLAATPGEPLVTVESQQASAHATISIDRAASGELTVRIGEKEVVVAGFDKAPLLSAGISPDGAYLALVRGAEVDFGASGRRARTARVALVRTRDLSVAAGDLESLPLGEGDSTGAILFTADSRTLVLETRLPSQRGARLTLWDVATLGRLDESVFIPADVSLLGFSRSTGRLVLGKAGDRGKSLFEVDLRPDPWAAEACRLAGEGLTRDEWSRYVSRELEYRPACVREGR